jgi:hypothetical protein
MHDDGIQDRPDRADPRPRRDVGDVDLGAPFPATTIAAGVIWIVFGLLNLVQLVFASPRWLEMFDATAAGTALQSGGVILVFIYGLFGGVFIVIGFQNLRGTAAGPLGDSIGSVFFAALGALVAAGCFVVGAYAQAAVTLLTVAGLLTAGVLALVGRAEYMLWKRSHQDRDP